SRSGIHRYRKRWPRQALGRPCRAPCAPLSCQTPQIIRSRHAAARAENLRRADDVRQAHRKDNAMIDLADDPTAAALLAVVPCHPVPVSGTSPALDALRAARAGHGLAVGHDGVMLILRRPWLAVDVPVTM